MLLAVGSGCSIGAGLPVPPQEPAPDACPHTLTVDLPHDICPDPARVHVSVTGEGAVATVYGQAVAGGMNAQQFSVGGLGPWRTWVRAEDDRKWDASLAKEACPAFARVIGPDVGYAVLDRSDLVVDRPDFASSNATFYPLDGTERAASAILDEQGAAIVTLPAGSTRSSLYCMQLVSADGRCEMTIARAGDVARSLERTAPPPECGPCRPSVD